MRKVIQMTRTDWEINIENLAARVAEKYGEAAVRGAFQRVGATCFDDLSPCYYDEVFGDLQQMDED